MMEMISLRNKYTGCQKNSKLVKHDIGVNISRLYVHAIYNMLDTFQCIITYKSIKI